MKRSRVVVPWPEGLHLRPAAVLVRTAQRYRSTIQLRCEDRIANLRSILSIMALCATMGAGLDLEISGDDELDASTAIEHLFSCAGPAKQAPALPLGPSDELYDQDDRVHRSARTSPHSNS